MCKTEKMFETKSDKLKLCSPSTVDVVDDDYDADDDDGDDDDDDNCYENIIFVLEKRQ